MTSDAVEQLGRLILVTITGSLPDEIIVDLDAAGNCAPQLPLARS
ncbi:hypothetical protein R8Z50_10555 [Longispora sp. K20-0274]